MGGTGKSPMVEYLYKQLQFNATIAIISRGYKRKTKGLYIVRIDDTAATAGDEALQFKQKHPECLVLVAEKRSIAIDYAIEKGMQCFILDDALQHHALRTNFNILLTTFGQPFFEDRLFPAGNLRDLKSNYSKASCIVVTKCPEDMNKNQKADFEAKIKLQPHQKLFFSSIRYGLLYALKHPERQISLQDLGQQKTILLSGIANPKPLLDYIQQHVKGCSSLLKKDHHLYTAAEIKSLCEERKGYNLITTEKDAVKLGIFADIFKHYEVQVWILPMQTTILFNQQEELVQLMLDYIHSVDKQKGL